MKSRDDIFYEIIGYLNVLTDTHPKELWRKTLWKTSAGHVLVWWSGGRWEQEWYEEKVWPAIYEFSGQLTEEPA